MAHTIEFCLDHLPAVSSAQQKGNNASLLSTNTCYVWEKGSILVHGPSGSGKTSLVRFLTGQESPVKGTLKMGNKTLVGTRSIAQWRSQIGIHLQQCPMMEQQNAWQNLRTSPRFSSGEEAREGAKHLDILSVCDRPVNELSQGQKQRLSLLRATLGKALWWILDEPFSHLDPQSRANACQWLERMRDRYQPGIILTSHVPETSLSGNWQTWRIG